MRIPGICNADPETTVLAHAPSLARGMGLKTNDTWAAFACSSCHDHADNHRSQHLAGIWLSAIDETQRIWMELGLLSFPADVRKPKASSKECKAYAGPKRTWPKGRKIQSGRKFANRAGGASTVFLALFLGACANEPPHEPCGDEHPEAVFCINGNPLGVDDRKENKE